MKTKHEIFLPLLGLIIIAKPAMACGTPSQLAGIGFVFLAMVVTSVALLRAAIRLVLNRIRKDVII